MTERMRSRIQAAEMRFLRRVAGLTLLDRVRSSEIRQGFNMEPALLQIERSQLRWIGHVLRMSPNRLVHKVWKARPIGRRPRGRPRTRWGDQALNIGGRLSLRRWTDIEAIANDRTAWRSLLRGLPARPSRTSAHE
jgi:hypothetical protein